MAAITMSCIALFMFKEQSRNAMNNERKSKRFRKNFKKIFKIKLPHMDTADEVMRVLEEKELEQLKKELVSGLIEKKVFYNYRLFGKYYKVAIDGTQVMNVSEGHCESCLYRTSKNGNTTYFHSVLEAKLICSNGFSISLCTEWIENTGEYDKQDCEQKAFKRLAEKLKTSYPRLPICITADGLYPNATFFKICKEKDWAWIVTFKDGNLPSVWEEVLCLQKITKNSRDKIVRINGKEIRHIFQWINEISYRDFKLNWFECVEIIEEERKRFVYISNIEIEYDTVLEMVETGRLRWKIENEGFNIQKNHGYGLTHKYSRVSMKAEKNYYQCMQIGHMFNQLFELSTLFQSLLTGKMTVAHICKLMLSQMREKKLKTKLLKMLMERKIQIRYG